jgi:hypothetical protein
MTLEFIILGLLVVIIVLVFVIFELSRDNKRVRRRLSAALVRDDKMFARIEEDRRIGEALRLNIIEPLAAAAILIQEVEL